MLKTSFKESILECLNLSHFNSAEFVLEEVEESDYWGKINVLTIKWRFENKYYFKVSIPCRKTSSSDNKIPHFEFKTMYSPGELSDEESMSYSDEKSLHEAIKTWLLMLEEQMINKRDLKILRKKLEEQETVIFNINAKIDGLVEDSFSDEEEEVLNNKLDEIRAEINSKLDEHNSKSEAYKEELSKMKLEIEFLKSTIDQMNKKDWLKMFAIKVFNWSKKPENKQLLSAGMEVAKLALPEDVKNLINNE